MSAQRGRPPFKRPDLLIESCAIVRHHILIHHAEQHLSHVLVHLRGLGIGVVLSVERSRLLGGDIEHIDAVTALDRR